MINKLNDIAQLDVNSGVVHSYTQIFNDAPAFDLDPATWWLKDNGRMFNEAFKLHLRFDDMEATICKLMLGCNSSGAGVAIQFDFSATAKWIRLVTTTGIDQAYSSVLHEVDISSKAVFTNAQYIGFKTIISNGKLQFWYGTIRLFDIQDFVPLGTYWGVCNLTGSTKVYTSDMYYIQDQILWGNVNLNGEPDMDGIVVVYNQSTYIVESVQPCDPNGEYMVFLDVDPAQLNKYFLYGFIPNIGYVQPRGVTNITL